MAHCRFAEVADTGIPTDIHQRLIHLSVSNVICSVVFGKRFPFNDEPFNAAVEGIKFLFSSSVTFRLEGIPLVRHLPFVKRLKAEENRHRKNVVDLVERQIQLHKEEFDVHCPKDFIDLALQKAELDKEQKSKIGTDNIKKIILDLFFAGDTIGSIKTNNNFLSILSDPELLSLFLSVLSVSSVKVNIRPIWALKWHCLLDLP